MLKRWFSARSVGEIDELQAPGGGRVGLVRCPGLYVEGETEQFDPARVEADLEDMRAWSADGVVTLMMPAELDGQVLDKLRVLIRAHHMLWWHLPMPESQDPPPDFERYWQTTADSLHALLDRDGRLILHSRTGYGRNGCIAARLLVDRGMTPEQAIRKVRRARRGAITSGYQEDWIHRRRGHRPRSY